MRCFLPFLFAVFLAQAFGADSQSPACVAPNGVPCHTLTVKTEEWTFVSLFDIRYRGGLRRGALRESGSAAVHEERTEGFWPFGLSRDVNRVFLAGADQVVSWSSRDNTYSARAAISSQDRPPALALSRSTSCEMRDSKTWSLTRGRTETIAGIEAIEWVHPLPSGDYRVWLAPALHCQAVKFESVLRNSWGLPIRIDSSTVTAIAWGEPDPALFEQPKGYRLVQDPALRYVTEFKAAEEAAQRERKGAFLMAGPPEDWISFGSLR